MRFEHTIEMYSSVMDKFKHTDNDNIINHNLIKSAFPKRNKIIHKNSCGVLSICAGSEGYTGAACMASEAALRTGAGLITLICQKELNPIYEIKLTEVMTMPVESENGMISDREYPRITEKLKNSDACLFGPGMSWNTKVKNILTKILSDITTPMIIDADGINVLSENPNILIAKKCPVIMTPHIGEFARLVSKDTTYVKENQKQLASDFAQKYNVVLVLKSHNTIVTDGNVIYENILGNPGMATGGSGDVLSGTIASLLAQGNSPLMSALAGVYIHSLSADMAVMEYGEYSLTPSDIIEYIPYAIMHTISNLQVII